MTTNDEPREVNTIRGTLPRTPGLGRKPVSGPDEPRTLVGHAAELREALLTPRLCRPANSAQRLQATLARMCLALAERVEKLEHPVMTLHGDEGDEKNPPTLVEMRPAISDDGRATRDLKEGEVFAISPVARRAIDTNTIEKQEQTIHELRTELQCAKEGWEADRLRAERLDKMRHELLDSFTAAEDISEKRRDLVDEFSGKLVAARKERDSYAREALVALAGSGICTPEKGFIADGGVSQMGALIRGLRQQRDCAVEGEEAASDLVCRYSKVTTDAWERTGDILDDDDPAQGWCDRLASLLDKLISERTPPLVAATGDPLKLPSFEGMRARDPHAEAIIESTVVTARQLATYLGVEQSAVEFRDGKFWVDAPRVAELVQTVAELPTKSDPPAPLLRPCGECEHWDPDSEGNAGDCRARRDLDGTSWLQTNYSDSCGRWKNCEPPGAAIEERARSGEGGDTIDVAITDTIEAEDKVR